MNVVRQGDQDLKVLFLLERYCYHDLYIYIRFPIFPERNYAFQTVPCLDFDKLST